MKRLYGLLIVVIAFAVLLVVHLVTAAHSPRLDPTDDHGSWRTNAWGTGALRELLQATGLKTSTWGRPWEQLTPQVAQMWILDPQFAPTQSEVQSLLRWVSGGGRVVVAVDPRLERRALTFRHAETANILLLALLDAGVVAVHADDKARARGPRADPLLRDVRAVNVPASWRLVEDPRPEAVRAALRAREGPRLEESEGDRKARVEVPGPVARLRGEPLLSDAAGVAASRIRHGKGEIILLCDADIVSNAVLPHADNVVFASNLAFAGPGQEVWFDEYHHRFEESHLDGTAAYRAIWAGLAALALYFLGRLWRFGTPIPLGSAPRRSSLEYVRAFASLYRRARQRRAVLTMVLSRFRGRLALLGGIRADAPARSLATAAARRNPRLDAAQVVSCLERAEELLSPARALDDGGLLQTVREIAHLEAALDRST